ncbi:MAG: dephospho-CoA kinase [Planctomycetaceae bacterium]|jgi:dephospho-CoA kinase|nr:dephospho-CoA kinase [Planctomycetaceae bacterium]
MKIIGLVGGIGSGKSTVAQIIGKRDGAVVLDADKLGHDVLLLDEVKTLIRNEWGGVPFDINGEIDRRKLAAIVFSGTKTGDENLDKLKKISLPRIATLLKSQIDRAKMKKKTWVLLDAPLLLEGGWDKFCNAVIFIDTPENLRLERAASRGWTKEEYYARTQRQIPLEKKRLAAKFILRNDCSFEQLKERINAILENI